MNTCIYRYTYIVMYIYRCIYACMYKCCPGPRRASGDRVHGPPRRIWTEETDQAEKVVSWRASPHMDIHLRTHILYVSKLWFRHPGLHTAHCAMLSVQAGRNTAQ